LKVAAGVDGEIEHSAATVNGKLEAKHPAEDLLALSDCWMTKGKALPTISCPTMVTALVATDRALASPS
jgi:hypothetical protein